MVFGSLVSLVLKLVNTILYFRENKPLLYRRLNQIPFLIILLVFSLLMAYEKMFNYWFFLVIPVLAYFWIFLVNVFIIVCELEPSVSFSLVSADKWEKERANSYEEVRTEINQGKMEIVYADKKIFSFSKSEVVLYNVLILVHIVFYIVAYYPVVRSFILELT